MTITLPDSMLPDLERRARESGFLTVDEYIVSVLREDQKGAEGASDEVTAEQLGFDRPEELEAKLLASLESGPAIPATPEFWENLRARVAGLTSPPTRP